jgi:type IV pilus assembly protein PilA
MNRAFTLVELVLAVSIGALALAVALPNFLQSRKHGNEASAMGALKTIATSEALFREQDREMDANLDYGMLSELGTTGLVDPVLGSGRKKGYAFEATYSYTTSEFLWFATANPLTPGTSGDRYWNTNQAGVIFYSTRGPLRLDTLTCSLPNHGVIPC